MLIARNHGRLRHLVTTKGRESEGFAFVKKTFENCKH